MRYFQSIIQPEFFFIQLGTLITPTYRFIEIIKVQKMERAENSDLDTSLGPSKYGNIFREQEFRRKVPSEYAYMRTQLGKEIYIIYTRYCTCGTVLPLQYWYLVPGTGQAGYTLFITQTRYF